jgi:peptide chain release factor subunit 1
MKKEYDMIKEIKRLKSIRGAGTELISVYIPAGYQLSEETNRLRQENSSSSNIKSKSTRTNVQGALEKIIQYLKLYRETPKNGLVIFAGNISKDQSKDNIELFSMEPPMPMKVNIYRCDSTFLLEPIEDMIEAKDTYALLAMDGREATIATLKGSHIQVVRRHHSLAHAKMSKGGQSAGRFERAREEDIEFYYSEISESINDLYQQNQNKLKGLIVGGPGPAKENFIRRNKLNYQVKVLGVFDTGYTDETGLNEIVEKAHELLTEVEASQERKILERFKSEIAGNGLAVHGYEKTKEALEKNKAHTLIINNELELHRTVYKCSVCGSTMEHIDRDGDRLAKHDDDGGTLTAIEDNDAIEELIDRADKIGAETVFVSSESSLGKEFLMGFGGIGALLRYK